MFEDKKYSRLRCLLRVQGLVICFYLGWSGSILQFKQNIIKIGSKSWLLTCSSNITLCLPSYTCSAFCQSWPHCKPKPFKAYREKPVFITRNPVLITGILLSLQGFPCKTLYFPVWDCSAWVHLGLACLGNIFVLELNCNFLNHHLILLQ